METNVFGQPENNQPEVVEREGSNPALIIILLALIVIGGGVLGFLLYRQSQEPAPVLDEVVEVVDLPSSATTPAPANSESNNPAPVQ
jgi:hypothetical protein